MHHDNCLHCGREIAYDLGVWVDPEADGDDVIWRETCDSHDTFVAEHEPADAGLEDDLRTIRKWDGA